MTKLLHILLFLTLFGQSLAFAKAPNKNTLTSNSNILLTDKIDINNGLAHNGVTSLLTDSRGYLWIGTYDGLNSYNGFRATTYKNSVNENLFRSNRIRSLAEDRMGRIWIGSDIGVTVLDYKHQEFNNLEMDCIKKNDNNLIIRDIFIADNNVICLSERDGIIVYDLNYNFIKQDRYSNDYTFNSGVKLDNNNYIFATDEGLVYYNLNSGNFTQILEDVVSNARSIVKFNNNTLLVGCEFGLQKVNFLKSNKDDKYNFRITKDREFKDKRIKAIAVDNNNGVLLGDVANGATYISNYNNEDSKDYTIIQSRRISSFNIDNNNCYIATFDDGIYKYSFKSNIYTNFKNYNLQLPIVTQLDRDNLIINSKIEGQGPPVVYNKKLNKIEELPFKLSNKYSNLPMRFMKDSDGILWIFILDNNENIILYLNEGKIIELKSPMISKLESEIPTCITSDMFGNIWVGYNDNLFKITLTNDRKIESIESICENSFFNKIDISDVRYIYPDKLKNIIWVGTATQGLYKINIEKGASIKNAKIENFIHNNNETESISSNFVISILRTPDKNLWVATEQGGFCKVNEKNNKTSFTTYSEANGLSNNVVKGLLHDNNGNLWIPTNIGLSVYNIKDNKFHIYRKTDGLPIDEYWYTALKDTDGKFILSSVNNLCIFNPNNLPKEEDIPKLNFSYLKIYNDIVAPGTEFNNRKILNHKLVDNDEIILKHNENVFSIGIDAIYPTSAYSHNIHYILEPTSTKWTTIHASEQEINFNGLKSGKYKLKVYATNIFGKETKVQTINIRVKPPFYNSIYAYIMYIIILLATSYIGIRTLLRIQSLNYKIEMEEKESKNLKELNIERQRFFSNISHELKTPLTLIIAPIALLNERFKLDIDVKSKLEIIQRQSKKMLQLIDLAHGIQLNDSNLLKLTQSTFSFNSFIQNTISDFVYLANYDTKELKIENPEEQIFVKADISMIEKIINNLLNNALKHTKSGDCITLRYRGNKNLLTLEVIDTGSGISEEDIPHIFERFYRANKNNNILGTGIGLSFSKRLVELHSGTISVTSSLNKGTTFTINLPIITNQDIESIEYSNTIISEPEVQSNDSEDNLIIGDSDISNIIINKELSNSTVFLVEDNSEVRLFMEEIISNFFKVKCFANAKECLDSMQTEWPNIIVSDVMMPEMSGDELCKIIKSDVKTSHIPIILLTACNTIDDRINGLLSGADAYINKPFYPKHVITRIENLLQNRQKLRERFQLGIPVSYGNSAEASAKENEFLEALYCQFQNNIDNDEIDIDSIATELGMSRSIFFNKVKELTNDTPYELLKNYRLSYAATLLEKKIYNINEVCSMTGFKSRTHFSRLFKEKYNVSPSKYGQQLT